MAHLLLVAKKTAGKVETQIQLIDFAKNDPAALNALKSVVGGLDVGVLGESPTPLFIPLVRLTSDVDDSEQCWQIAHDADIFCRDHGARKRRHRDD